MAYGGLLCIYLKNGITLRIYLSDRDLDLREQLDKASEKSRSKLCAALLRLVVQAESDRLLVKKIRQAAKKECRSFSSMVKLLLREALAQEAEV